MIFLDNASTTYVSNEVVHEMLPCFNVVYGNSNSLHAFGRDAAAIVDRERDRVAKAIGAKSNEIYFTSGLYIIVSNASLSAPIILSGKELLSKKAMSSH